MDDIRREGVPADNEPDEGTNEPAENTDTQVYEELISELREQLESLRTEMKEVKKQNLRLSASVSEEKSESFEDSLRTILRIKKEK